MLSIDITYLQLIPLDQFSQIDSNKWNFRCPVCGDSKRKKNLKRGNAQIWNGELFIKCFNCSYSKPFSYFIKTEFPEHYMNYRIDKLKANPNTTFTKNNVKKDAIIKREYTKIELPCINKLPLTHIAVKEVKRRLIPKKNYNRLYYSENFAKWVNTIILGKCKFVRNSDKRLVIPIFDRFNKLIGMQGRTLEDAFPKYQTIKLNPTDDLLYGVDRVNDSKIIYVTEGPIDSMFLDNSLATCTSISKFKSLESIAPTERFVLVYDNEKRNPDTVKYMKKALEQGFKIVIWHKDIVEKDINEIIMKKKITKKELYAIIESNSYVGKSGLVKLKFWRK